MILGLAAILTQLMHLALVLALAPVLVGLVRLVKARLMGRRGPALLQPWRDLAKLLRKRPVLAEGTALAEDETEEFYDEADHDTVATIKDLLETRVRPAVAGDGGEGALYLPIYATAFSPRRR